MDSLHDRVRDVLIKDWDPTNAARSESASGAYDLYLSPICDLIRSNAGEEAIIDFLYAREHEILCFPGLGRQRLRRVARRLLSLNDVVTDR